MQSLPIDNVQSKPRPVVSIIIPARNSADTLPQCLDALQKQVDSAEFPHEIIVVDDDSTDNTAAVAKRYGVRVIQEGRLGKSGTRNRGAQLALGDLLLFTDADCIPAPDWLSTMSAPFFADPDLVAIKGRYRTQQKSWVARFIQLEHQERYTRMAQQPTINFIDTYSAAYRRDQFLAQGGFDPQLTFSYVEDQEFSFRLAAAGCKMRFIPSAVVYHRHITSPLAYARRKFSIAYWKALIVQRHPARMLHDSRTPQSLKIQMAIALLILPLLPLAVIWPPARRLLALSDLLFSVSALSFLRLCLARDPLIALIALPMLFVRALALGLGYLAGTIQWRGERRDRFLRQTPAPLTSVHS